MLLYKQLLLMTFGTTLVYVGIRLHSVLLNFRCNIHGEGLSCLCS